MNRGVIVLGMHRSGTSLVAQLIHQWGAFGRIQECLPSDQWNAHGYWELGPLVDLNRRLLREVGANWSFPPSQARDGELAALARDFRYREEARALVDSMSVGNGNLWFWKDPRLSLLLPFWQQFWYQPRYVICVRDPLEICRSLRDRDQLSLSVSMLLWHRYMLSALEGTRDKPVLFMSYSQMLRNPEQECRRLARFLCGEECDHLSAEALRGMKGCVDAKLRHCQSDGYQVSRYLSKDQRNLLFALEQMAGSDDPAAVSLQGCQLPPGWRGVLRAELVMQRLQQRWKRVFGDTSEAGELADSYVQGLGLLEVNLQFSGHNGVLLDSLLTQGCSETIETKD